MNRYQPCKLIDTLHLCSLIRRHGFLSAQYAQGAAHEGKHFIFAGENVQGRQSVYALFDGAREPVGMGKSAGQDNRVYAAFEDRDHGANLF
jgi:hypothetical protein